MQTIDHQELKRMMDEKQDFVLIEALPESSFREEHLPGAINIPVEADDFDELVKDAIPDKDQDVVLYCANTECPASPKAAKKMEAMGYTHVYDYEAGKADWKEAGLQTVH